MHNTVPTKGINLYKQTCKKNWLIIADRRFVSIILKLCTNNCWYDVVSYMSVNILRNCNVRRSAVQIAKQSRLSLMVTGLNYDSQYFIPNSKPDSHSVIKSIDIFKLYTNKSGLCALFQLFHTQTKELYII